MAQERVLICNGFLRYTTYNYQYVNVYVAKKTKQKKKQTNKQLQKVIKTHKNLIITTITTCNNNKNYILNQSLDRYLCTMYPQSFKLSMYLPFTQYDDVCI